MVKVSVIMPVYNSEKYVENTIKTILAQSMKEFELILVDDGSTDKSGQICDRLAETDSRIIVIHKENGGISSARNAGLENAKGVYVAFCDNDDEYLPGLLEDNYKLALEYDADLVRFGRVKEAVDEKGRVYSARSQYTDACYTPDQFAENYADLSSFDNVWAGLYRKKIIVSQNCIFDETMIFGSEDKLFNLEIFPNCKKIVFNSKSYYKWVQRDTHSTSKKFNLNLVTSQLKCMEAEEKYIESLKGEVSTLTKVDALAGRYIIMILYYLSSNNAKISFKEKKDILEAFSKQTICSKEEFQSVKKEFFKKNKKQYLIMELFYQKRYGLMLLISKIGGGILTRMRFRISMM